MISYPSVLNEGENGTPFGQAIQDVLEKTLEICRDIGFTTYLDPKGYYGYAEIGQGAELLAILCHLDVVPSGDEADWQTPPFEATIKDGWVFGRGVQDDKGPSLAALYAVKSLLDQGIQFKSAYALSLVPMRKPSGAAWHATIPSKNRPVWALHLTHLFL